MEKLGIEIHLNTEIKDLNKFKNMPVIIATGSKPRVLKNVKGNELMIEACDYLYGNKEAKGDVVVIGGGLTGCEIAYDLALKGHNVKIVEMKNDLIAQKGVCLANSSYLREWFKWKNVSVYLNSRLKEVMEDKVICVDENSKEFEIKCDTAISSAGYIPNPLITKGKNVYLVGDCNAIGNLRTVIWRAYEVAMKI